MNGERRLRYRKKSAGGAFERLALLREHGITLDLETLGEAAPVPLDDVLDAAACAWTAARVARAEAPPYHSPIRRADRGAQRGDLALALSARRVREALDHGGQVVA